MNSGDIKKIVLQPSDKSEITLYPNDIIKIKIVEVNKGHSEIYVTGASLISTMLESKQWNELIMDAKTGEKFTIVEYLSQNAKPM